MKAEPARVRTLPDGTPVVEVEFIAVDNYGREPGKPGAREPTHWSLNFECPFGCRKNPHRKSSKPMRHFHGGGLIGESICLGHRVAHCAPEFGARTTANKDGHRVLIVRGYFLTLKDAPVGAYIRKEAAAWREGS